MKLDSENKISSLLDGTKLNLVEIFEVIRCSKFEKKSKEFEITKEFVNNLKIKIIEHSLDQIQAFDEEAKVFGLKGIIKTLKINFKYILKEYGPDLHLNEIAILEKNIIAALQKELKIMTESKSEVELPKIQINCDITVLYALFNEISEEIFVGEKLQHRISRIISQNFIGKDYNPIDQKTSYNKLKLGSSANAKKNLSIILEKISKRIK